MEIVLEETKFLKDALMTLSKFIEECKIQFKNEGIVIEASNSSNIMMVLYRLSSKSFSKYKLDKEIVIAVSMTHLLPAIRIIKETDVLYIDISDIMKFTLKGKTIKRISIPLMDVEIEDKAQPKNIKWDIKGSMSSKSFEDNLNDLLTLSTSTIFIIKDGKLILKGNNDKRVATTLDIFFRKKDEFIIEYLKRGDEDKPLTVEDKQNRKEFYTKFNNDLLKHIISATKISNNCYIYLRKDFPIKVLFESKDRAMIQFILAPLIDN